MTARRRAVTLTRDGRLANAASAPPQAGRAGASTPGRGEAPGADVAAGAAAGPEADEAGTLRPRAR
jgi:hypothetical protein